MMIFYVNCGEERWEKEDEKKTPTQSTRYDNWIISLSSPTSSVY